MRYFLLFIFIISGGVSLSACRSSTPQMALETKMIDLGDVVNGDIIERVVTVSNTGTARLVVDSVSTSCGCTSATLTPMTIAPGETASLHIELDSGAHGPELTGSLIRQVFLASNDPNQPEAQVELSVNVLPRP